MVHLALGRPDEAVKVGDESLRRSRQLKQPFVLATTLMAFAVVRYQRREPEATRALAELCIALAEEYGFRERLAEGRWFRQWAISESSPTEQGVIELEAEVVGRWPLSRLAMSPALAQLCIRVGRPDRALAFLDEELVRIEHSGSYLEQPELYTLKGEAVLARDSKATGEAEGCFRNAIEIAKGQSAKWFELRATVSFARLLRDTNRRHEALTMLAEIYGWFTEGFDTPDLKDAKALLDELSAGSP
jgi:hypothetical protein